MNQRIEGIDITRGLLALSVAIYHYVQFLNISWLKKIHPIINLGLTSVDGFFIISGFALFYCYHHTDFTNSQSISRYFYKRFIRIAPLFYLCMLIDTISAPLILLTLALVFLFGALSLKRSTAHWIKFSFLSIAVILLLMLINPSASTYDRLLLINNISFLFGFLNTNLTTVRGGWSIGIEYVFYFALPFIISLSKRNVSIILGITFVSVILALNYILLNNTDLYSYNASEHARELVNHWPLYTNLLNHMYFFMSGITLFLIYDRYHSTLSLKKPLLLKALAILVVLYCLLDQVTGNPSHGIGRIIYSLLTLAIISITPFIIMKDSWLKRKLITLGDISYSVYLMQFPVYTVVMYYTNSLGLPNEALLVLTITCLMMTARLTHALYEMPTKQWLMTIQLRTRMRGVRVIS